MTRGDCKPVVFVELAAQFPLPFVKLHPQHFFEEERRLPVVPLPHFKRGGRWQLWQGLAHFFNRSALLRVSATEICTGPPSGPVTCVGSMRPRRAEKAVGF